MPTGGYCIGATFQHDDTEITPRITDHAENLAQLESLLPGFAAAFNPAMLKGRVAWRATTPDRLPIFGALQPGLCLATGLGARGLLWAPLGAELVAASLNDEPLPIERELVDAISPRRFDN
jgi:tRNA 5-methylaminomethyl-2-thiouridine biosynthesis bifunctional protein